MKMMNIREKLENGKSGATKKERKREMLKEKRKYGKRMKYMMKRVMKRVRMLNLKAI